jgi:hypothetical protein
VTLLAVGLLAGCGVAGHGAAGGGDQGSSGVALHGHPQAVEPVAGAAANLNPAGSGPSEVSVGAAAGDGSGLSQPLSNAQVRAELAESGISANPDQATLTPGGLAQAPVNAPLVVQDIISAGDAIAHLPYVFGGGHGTFEDTAYDCSGSLSYVLISAGLLKTTETSGQLMSYGDPGRGKWITIFANAGHTFAYIAGLRFDTVALSEGGSRWSNRAADEPDLNTFAVRHPPGL